MAGSRKDVGKGPTSAPAGRPVTAHGHAAPAAPELAPGRVSLVDLQRTAGNQAVALALQRIAVNAEFHETIYNQEGATGRAVAPPRGFTGGSPTTVANPTGASYEMTREGAGVTVLIKIRFLQQPRNTSPPPNPNPTNLPALGQLTNTPSEIPASDPSGRRAWATATAGTATALWNTRRITFSSVDHPPPGTPGAPAPAEGIPVRLPVTFRSEAVFGLNDPAHQQVIVHPPTSIPGTPGHPIDAGNWYHQGTDPATRSASYPASDEMIYAHEYGHMLGIPDEYSQSNAQMNALIHQAAPATAASSQAALERRAVERMALAALTRPLLAQLDSAVPLLMGSLSAKRAAVTRKLAAAARAGVVSAEVRDALRTQLTAEAEAARSPEVPGVVAFQTTRNFSNLDIAGDATRGAFEIGAVQRLLRTAYATALTDPHSSNVAVAGFDDVRIDVSSGTYAAAGAGTPIAGAAAATATTAVGPAAGPAGAPGLPPVVPATSLVGQLAALPGTWAAAGSALEAGVTPAAFSTAMAAALRSSAAAATLAAALPGAVPPARLASTRALYRRGLSMVTASAGAAARQVANDLLLATFRPTLDASVSALTASLAAEITRVTTTPPAGMAAAGPADPQMAAVVAAMKARLDADKAASAVAQVASTVMGRGSTTRDPTAGGGAAPDQSVTYTAQGIMGANATAAARPDQLQPMLGHFNTQLRRVPREDAFTVGVGS